MDAGRFRKRKQDEGRRIADGLSYSLHDEADPELLARLHEETVAERQKEAAAPAFALLKDPTPPHSVPPQVVPVQNRPVTPLQQRPVIKPLPRSAITQPITPTQPQPSTKPAKPAQEANVSIQISFPEFHLPDVQKLKRKLHDAYRFAMRMLQVLWKRLKPVLRTKRFIAWAAVVLVVIAAWGALAFNKQRLDNAHKKTAQSTATSSAKQPASGGGSTSKPPFTPVVPTTKPALATPDGQRSSYDSTKGSYSFYDTLNGKKFIVSQQQLPSSDAASKAAAAAAHNLKATKMLKSGWGTVYQENITQSQSQIMVFSLKQILVFIQASFTASDEDWLKYINALQ